jgi:hypothetical protein
MTSHRLASLAERALKWSALTTIARFVLQLGAQVALALVMVCLLAGRGVGGAVCAMAGMARTQSKIAKMGWRIRLSLQLRL